MKRIMIVEDETAIREFEAINLKRVGYTVVEAGSGEEALEIYDSDAALILPCSIFQCREWMALLFVRSCASAAKRSA